MTSISLPKAAFVIYLALALGLPSSALAFWFGAIPSDGIELKESADPLSKTVETLSQGARFSAVDQPTNGYYRVRTKTGSGYVDAAVIESQNTHSQNAAPAPPISSDRPQSSTRYSKRTPPPPRWSLRPFVGVTLSNPTDVSNAIGNKVLSDPLSLGFEVEYRVNSQWRLALFRFDYLTKSVTGPDSTTNNTYQIGLKAYSLTVGADYTFADAPKYDLLLGGRVGFGHASLSSVATNLSSPNETDFSGTTFSGLIFLGTDYKAWTHFWLGAEAGYRILSTSQAGPTATGGGNSIWTSPVGLGFSGFYGTINIRVLF